MQQTIEAPIDDGQSDVADSGFGDAHRDELDQLRKRSLEHGSALFPGSMWPGDFACVKRSCVWSMEEPTNKIITFKETAQVPRKRTRASPNCREVVILIVVADIILNPPALGSRFE
eukprot:3257705-Pyramimonas_sp.AAC.1